MQPTQLQLIQLGTTGVESTRVGFGAWATGGGWAFGWGPRQDEKPGGAVHPAPARPFRPDDL